MEDVRRLENDIVRVADEDPLEVVGLPSGLRSSAKFNANSAFMP
jgi:hypothetical protein